MKDNKSITINLDNRIFDEQINGQESRKNKKFNLKGRGDVRELLDKLQISYTESDYPFVIVNGRKAVLDDKLNHGDEVKIFPQMSGG